MLDRPVAPWGDPAVRRLTATALPRMEEAAAPPGMEGWRFCSAAELLVDDFAAGAVVEDRLLAVAFASARTAQHAEIGIVTQEPWRGRGRATVAASLVCGDVQAAGQRPVWSTAEENRPSRRVAAKLGFVAVGRRVYVDPLPADDGGSRSG